MREIAKHTNEEYTTPHIYRKWQTNVIVGVYIRR